MVAYNDESNSTKTAELYARLIEVDAIDYLFGPYGSSYTKAAVEVTAAHDRLMIFSQASDESIFAGGAAGSLTFGLMSGASKYSITGMEALREAGARTLAVLYNTAGFTDAVYAGLVCEAGIQGMTVVAAESYPPSATNEEIVSKVGTLLDVDNDVDVFVSLNFLRHAVLVVDEIQRLNGRPKAIFMTSAPSNPRWVDENVESLYTIGMSQWHWQESHSGSVFGDAQAFSAAYKTEYPTVGDVHASQYAAGGAATGVVFALALSSANTSSQEDVAAALHSLTADTFYGRVGFDSVGQNSAATMISTQVLALTRSANRSIEIVAPMADRRVDIVYPIPYPAPPSTSTTGPTSSGSFSAPRTFWVMFWIVASCFLLT